MIQESFSFDLGESGDKELIDLTAEHLCKRWIEDFKAGRLQAAMRSAVRMQKLCGLGSLVGAFVRDSIAYTGSTEDCLPVADAWTAYEIQMREHRQPTLTKSEFDKLMPSAMRQAYGVKRVNSLKKAGRNVRGYYRCRLKRGGLPQSPPLERSSS